MKRHITTAAIIAALLLPAHALAEGMPVIDIQGHLDALTQTQIWQTIQNIQTEASKLQDTIMKKVQDMVGTDKTVQASKDAMVKTIDSSTPKTAADIEKKMRDLDHNVASYKTPDEQAADLLRIKNDQYNLNKQCSDQKTAILKAKSQNAHAYSDFLKSLGGKDTVEYKKNEGKIESYKAADAAYAADMEQLQAECEKQAKLLEEEYKISTQGTVISYEQKLEKDTEESYAAIKKNVERTKNHDK